MAADMGLTESGEQKEGMPEDNAQSGRPVMNGSSVVGDSASAEMKVEGMERAGHEERPVEAPPAADGATAAVPMEMDDAPLPKQEDSMPSAETEVQEPPEAAAGQEGEGSGSEETMKVEPAAGEDSALPPPAELPSFLAPCLRGRLQVSPDGRHVCKGLWAMKRDDHNLEGDDLAKVTNKFEFSAMPSSPDVQVRQSTLRNRNLVTGRLTMDLVCGLGWQLPMDGTYQGFFWITLKQLQKMEDTCQLQFAPNSAGGWNISGSGKNKCGTYQITGTVSAEKNLELFRLFDHLLKGKVPSSSKSKKSSSKKAPAPRPSIEQRAPPAFNLDGNSVTGSIDSTVSHLTVSTSLRRHDSAALPPSPALSRSNTGVALASINVQGAALGVSKAGRVIKTRMPLGEPEDRARPDRLTNKCLEILRRLMTQPASYLFNEPVNPERDQCPDYYLVINTPMDFGSIKAKLEHLEYPSPDAFADDVRLVFQNAVRYNPRPEHFVNIAACQLSEIFENRFNSVFPSDYDVLDDDHVGMPTLGNGRPSNVRKSGGGGGGGGAKAGKKRQRPADLSYFEGEFMDEDLPIDDEIGLMEFDELPDTPGLVDLPHEPAKPPPIKKAKSGGFGRKSGGGGGARRPAPVAPADTQMTKALLQRIEALEKEVKAKK